MTNVITATAPVSHYTRYSQGIDPNMPAHYYEFYTPKHIVDAAIKVMGRIDLDPCSNSHINPNIPSAYRYTKDDNGLQYIWYDKVFMNPPYGYAITTWIEKLQYHYEAGDVTEAITVFPASTNTSWFAALQKYPCCFIQKRLRFLRPAGIQVREANTASVVFYFGKNTEKFTEVFGRLGGIYGCVNPYHQG